MSPTYPLAGLRLVELSAVAPDHAPIAASYAGKLFADAGAEVIKVEPPGGDPLRRWKASARLGSSPALAPGETGALFHYLNGNKHSCVADLDQARGRDQLLALCREADLLLVDLREASQHFETCIRTLREQLPQLSVVALSNWGPDSPCRGRAANEFTLQAEIGATDYRGYDDRPPIGTGGQIGEYLGGTSLALAAFSAWLMADQGASGSWVDVSLFETLLLCMQPYQYVHSQLQPGVPMPRSVEIPSIEPAADGWVGFCTVTDKQWQSLAELIGQPQLGSDPQMANSYLRYLNFDTVVPPLHRWTRSHTVEEILEQASRQRIPVAPIGDGRSVLQMAQMQARHIYQHNPAGFQQPRPPYRLQRGELRRPAPGPTLNQHPPDFWTQRNPSQPAPGDPASDLPLSGLRVVDFTAFWAGPYATCGLAALGADVIKIESIQRPDGMRFSAGMPVGDLPIWEISPISHAANTNKRAITLDLEQPEGIALAKQLIAGADIVIENFSPRVMERFGLGWDTVHELNPEAIMVRMPAFGLEGPWRDRTGFAMTIEQVSGLAWLTGYPDRSPLVPRGCVDPLGGMNAIFATLTALRLRQQGLGGQLVEVPLVESGLAIAAEQVVEYTAYGNLLERDANRMPNATPQGVFQGSDGAWLAISVSCDAHWQALLAALESEGWDISALRDPQLTAAEARRARQDEIEAQLGEFCATRPAASLAERLSLSGVPAAFLANVRDLHRHPHPRSTGFFARLDHAVVGALDYPGFPFRFNGRYLPIQRPAPLLGEHNREVLQRLLGLSDEELAALEAAQVIGSQPRFM